MSSTLQQRILAPGCVCIVLNRSEQRNALNAQLICDCVRLIQSLNAAADCRVILLTGAGSAFCAGLDLRETLERGAGDPAENVADAEQLAELLLALHTSRKPTIALVNGAAFGAGVGLVSACDIAICSESAQFKLPEVQLGIVPAAISPYLLAAIGQRNARRYCLTADTIEASVARDIGLVHSVVRPDDLSGAGLTVAQKVLKGGPQALCACKQLLDEVAHRPIGKDLAHATAQVIARQRASVEGQEGITAALTRRLPAWRQS